MAEEKYSITKIDEVLKPLYDVDSVLASSIGGLARNKYKNIMDNGGGSKQALLEASKVLQENLDRLYDQVMKH